MKRVVPLLLAVMAAASAAPVLGLGRLAEVSIIDRDTGEVLRTHPHRGEYWVAGRPGARYAIAIRNRSGERLLAVTSVDGINAVTGETAGWHQAGYVFDPGQSYWIAGWRKSEAQIAAFEFTAAPDSYAARTGRVNHVGIIGVALFRERRPEPAPPAVALAPDAGAQERAATDVAGGASAPRLGTGHGAREYDLVERTEFARRQGRPDEILRIRYDSPARLVSLGVIRPPRPRAVLTPDAFPDTPPASYVPDPPPRPQ
ncbi:MAG: hypothetical protein IT480_16200 [Gammaproteobacteria bacterium]|nr:hypothetical protein [Gammaproteobacteria bacterium]